MTASCLCTLANLGVSPEHGADPWSDRAPSSDVVRIVLLCLATLSWPHTSIMIHIYVIYHTSHDQSVLYVKVVWERKPKIWRRQQSQACSRHIINTGIPVYFPCTRHVKYKLMRCRCRLMEKPGKIYISFHIFNIIFMLMIKKNVKCVLCCCLQKSSLNMLPVHVLQI